MFVYIYVIREFIAFGLLMGCTWCIMYRIKSNCIQKTHTNTFEMQNNILYVVHLLLKLLTVYRIGSIYCYLTDIRYSNTQK